MEYLIATFDFTTATLLLLLIIATAYIVMHTKRTAQIEAQLAQASERLKKLDGELKEALRQQQILHRCLADATRIKDEFTDRFLNLCLTNIEKLEAYRRMLDIKASSGKMDELARTLKSTQFIEGELEEFYENFDHAFLKLFPGFVDKFNKLLPKEDKIIVKPNEPLTTELRIFALIRLGITDSSRIATLLRCSVTTIYTYRSKMKKKSLYQESFEEEVMRMN